MGEWSRRGLSCTDTQLLTAIATTTSCATVVSKHLAQHTLFQECVGMHTDYVYENGVASRPVGEVKPQSEQKKFYDARKDIVESPGPIVAWFYRHQ